MWVIQSDQALLICVRELNNKKKKKTAIFMDETTMGTRSSSPLATRFLCYWIDNVMRTRKTYQRKKLSVTTDIYTFIMADITGSCQIDIETMHLVHILQSTHWHSTVCLNCGIAEFNGSQQRCVSIGWWVQSVPSPSLSLSLSLFLSFEQLMHFE